MFKFRKAFLIWLAFMGALFVTMTIVADYQYQGPRYIHDEARR